MRAGKAGSKVGIRRVAAEAGVSTATVSRTMSGRGPVGAATRARVLRVADRLQYRPSAAARTLRTDRTMIIGVLLPDLSNPVFVPFLRGVQLVAQSHDYDVFVVDSQRSAEVERRALDRFRALGVDALVLAGPVRDRARLDELRGAGMVVVDPDLAVGSLRPLVADLERPGTRAMCDALADLGHRRIAYVSSEKVPGDAGRRRWLEVNRRCSELGVRVDRLSIGRMSQTTDVAGLLREVLERPEPVSALVSSSHGLAPTLLRGLRSAGADLPGDCSFVTYGDSEWAEAYRPAISVVTLDLLGVGVTMTTLALHRLAGDSTTALGALPRSARFVRRDSVGSLRQ